ncbi:MAG TPA: glycosyltransferase family 9 protein [Desulfosalsimonadaceae bacterium]|nr:glycosyltransferase family 9 protein [Desulfosalsimonadaceae bacterium]
MDILFVKLGALGDVINTLPLAVSLKRHFNARIFWLVEPLSEPLLSRHPCVDQIIRFDKRNWRTQVRPTSRQLKANDFDLVLDLQRLWKSGLFVLMAKAARRIGFDRRRCKEMTWILPFERIPPADPGRHMLSQYLEFADYLGAPTEPVAWEIAVPDALPDALPANFFVLNIGATKPANRWTIEGFAGLADFLDQKYNQPSVITGGPEDFGMAEDIIAAAKTRPINMAGKTSIDELTALISRATLVVSCDTGPMHLAVALGRPVVALFGPSDPRRTGPYHGAVVQKDLPCVPCNRRHCETSRCMLEITPHDVMAEIDRLCKHPKP